MSARQTAFADQVQAAGADAQRVIARVARQYGAPVTDADEHPVVRRLVREVAGRNAFGMLAGCRHISPAVPSLAFYLAWRPERLACITCAAADLLVTRGTVEDLRCDGCGVLCDPPVIHSTMTVVGSVIISAGMCGDCFGAGGDR